MEGSVLTQIVLPLVLFAVMLGMGLSLTLDDFRRVAVMPKALIIGLLCQMIMLPLVGFGLVSMIALTPALAVGLMVLAFCPGGTTSNMFTYLSRGDLALSITLTAVASLITPFTIPLLTNLTMDRFLGETAQIALPVGQTIAVLVAITILPCAIGMVIYAKRPEFARRSEKVVKIASIVALFVIIAALVAKEWDNLPDWFAQVGIACLLLNVVTMAIGYFAGFAGKLERAQSITIGLEVGIQNGTTALFVTSTLLKNPEMSISPAIYSLIMFATAGAFGYIVNIGRPPREQAVTP
jgi:BASS family bile acid:Na+ symporter